MSNKPLTGKGVNLRIRTDGASGFGVIGRMTTVIVASSCHSNSVRVPECTFILSANSSPSCVSELVCHVSIPLYHEEKALKFVLCLVVTTTLSWTLFTVLTLGDLKVIKPRV